MMDGAIIDVIPDEYINFLHDILIMLCSVYNRKFEQIQSDALLWTENYELICDIHHVASFLYYRLGWQSFGNIL